MTENPKHLLDRVSESPHRPSKIAKTAAQNLSNDEEEQQEAPMGPSPRTQRYLVAIEYIGTRFSGSQQQPNFRTVVGVLEEAFHKFIGQPVSIVCSSRTDAGVHALSNVCHVDIQRISKRKPGEVLPPHEQTVVRRAVNHFLQKNEGDIMVIDVRCVPADFHARFKAQERTYFYRLLSGPEPLSTFERDRAWHVPEELDILAMQVLISIGYGCLVIPNCSFILKRRLSIMQEACKILVGHHDFSSFRAAGCQAKSPIRTLDELTVSEVVSTPYFPSIVERRQNNLIMEDLHASSNKSESDLPVSSISIGNGASGFNGEASLGFGIRRRHRCFVVRLLVGVLKAVGTGNLTISDVERILNAKSVTAASPMAPPCGLYLGHVKYDLP